jgi:hypothetical protein
MTTTLPVPAVSMRERCGEATAAAVDVAAVSDEASGVGGAATAGDAAPSARAVRLAMASPDLIVVMSSSGWETGKTDRGGHLVYYIRRVFAKTR